MSTAAKRGLALAMWGAAMLLLPAAAIQTAHAQSAEGGQVPQANAETYEAAISRLTQGAGIDVVWMDEELGAKPLPVQAAADDASALRSMLSRLNFVAVYTSETPERRLTRLVIMGPGEGDAAAVSAITASLTGQAGGLKDLTPEQVDAIAVEASEYVARISRTTGWQANAHLAHVNQMERAAVADGSYEAGLRYPNESAGYPPLYRPRPVGDPERETARAQALTTQMAIRGLHALSHGLEAASGR